jgi:DNA-binding CsgD family transcriptional regulator
VIEAIYHPHRDDVGWVQQALEVLETTFETSLGIGIQVIEHDADFSHVQLALSHGTGAMAMMDGAVRDFLGRQSFAELKAMYFPQSLANTQTELENQLDPEWREYASRFRRTGQVGDAVGLSIHPEPGVASTLCVALPEPWELSRNDRELLSRIALHFESGLRLRRRPEAVLGELSPEGRLLHAEPGLPSPEVLGRCTQAVERARGQRLRNHEDAIDPWSALIAGKMSLVERTIGARRTYQLLENAPTSIPRRALSRSETDIALLAARGVSGKLIAYALGISPASVSRSLASAAAKLGVASTRELVRLMAELAGDERDSVDGGTLAIAEGEAMSG